LSFDVAQPAELLEKCAISSNSGVADQSDGTCGANDRNSGLLHPLLRPPRSRGGRERQSDREVAPPHSITARRSSAPFLVGGERGAPWRALIGTGGYGSLAARHRYVRAIMPQELKTTTPASILTKQAALAVAKRLMRNLTQR
jgi:hypothetical protein